MTSMTLMDVLNSEMGTGLGLGLSSLVPPSIGYPFARRIGDLLAELKGSPIVRAVRANQWVLHRGQINPPQLNQLVRDTFRSSAHSLYEFWHLVRKPQSILNMVDFEPSFIDCLNRAKRGDQGTILVAPHMSNFDLIGRALALCGMDMQILSYPKPPGGYRWQNEIREIPGMQVTPMSLHALRQASETLRAHKVVLTAVDRPLPTPEGKYHPRFFGRPALMPIYHVRLALKHNLPITVVGARRTQAGIYKVWASNPITMQRCSELMQENVQNAEAILTVLAEFIRRAPEQWAMFYPVWPETLDLAA